MRHQIPNRHIVPSVLLLFLLILVLGAAPQTLSSQVDDGVRCFPETNLCIKGRIREFWEQNGGLPIFGLPITAQQSESVEGVPRQVQWFERHRLELHPENAPPYDVLVGRLGVERIAQQSRDWRSFPGGVALPECRFFEATRHNVCGDILEMWERYGIEIDGVPGSSDVESMALFGLPLSEPQLEVLSNGQAHTVQWFERARFELHLQNEPPNHVLLGLLGSEVHANIAAPIPTLQPLLPTPTMSIVPTPIVPPTRTTLPTPTHTVGPSPTINTPGPPTHTPLPTHTPAPTHTPRPTRATAIIRFVNHTGGQLDIVLSGPSKGTWSLGYGQMVEVPVVPGDYKAEATTVCGDSTRRYHIGHHETKEDRYVCKPGSTRVQRGADS